MSDHDHYSDDLLRALRPSPECCDMVAVAEVVRDVLDERRAPGRRPPH
jgi:hypothetical protein